MIHNFNSISFARCALVHLVDRGWLGNIEGRVWCEQVPIGLEFISAYALSNRVRPRQANIESERWILRCWRSVLRQVETPVLKMYWSLDCKHPWNPIYKATMGCNPCLVQL